MVIGSRHRVSFGKVLFVSSSSINDFASVPAELSTWFKFASIAGERCGVRGHQEDNGDVSSRSVDGRRGHIATMQWLPTLAPIADLLLALPGSRKAVDKSVKPRTFAALMCPYTKSR
jgi:hypothetical protein